MNTKRCRSMHRWTKTLTSWLMDGAVQRGRFMSLETIAPLSDDPVVKLPAVATA
jgi:hypothetical protein